MKNLFILAILAVVTISVHSSTVLRVGDQGSSSKRLDGSNFIDGRQTGKVHGGHFVGQGGTHLLSGSSAHNGGGHGKVNSTRVSQHHHVSALAHGGAHTLVQTGVHHGHINPRPTSHGGARPLSGGSSTNAGSRPGKVNVPHVNSKPTGVSHSSVGSSVHGKVNVNANAKPTANTHSGAHSSSGSSSHGKVNTPHTNSQHATHTGVHSTGGTSAHTGSSHGKVPATVQGGPHTQINNVQIPRTTTHRPRSSYGLHAHGDAYSSNGRNVHAKSGQWNGHVGVKAPSTNYQPPVSPQGGANPSRVASVNYKTGHGRIKVPSTNYQPPPV